jgi:hypothetical protein
MWLNDTRLVFWDYYWSGSISGSSGKLIFNYYNNFWAATIYIVYISLFDVSKDYTVMLVLTLGYARRFTHVDALNTFWSEGKGALVLIVFQFIIFFSGSEMFPELKIDLLFYL